MHVLHSANSHKHAGPEDKFLSEWLADHIFGCFIEDWEESKAQT